MLPDILTTLAEGRRQIAEHEAKSDRIHAEIEAERIANIFDAWQPIVDAIQAATPEWAHPGIQHPLLDPQHYRDHELLHRAAVIDIPGVAVIYAYCKADKIVFVPATWSIQHDDDEGKFFVMQSQPRSLSKYELSGPVDFAVALALAHDNYLQVPELEQRASNHNAARAAAGETPTPVPSWIDRAITNYGRSDYQAAIAAALIDMALDGRK